MITQSRAGLLDGSTVTVRPLCPDDFDAVVELHSNLSERETYFRFFTLHPSYLDAMARVLTSENSSGLALGAFQAGELVGVASCAVGSDKTVGEVAVVVAHDSHLRGIGSTLLFRVTQKARECGFRKLIGDVLVENRLMLEVLRNLGWHSRPAGPDAGVIRVEVDLADQFIASNFPTDQQNSRLSTDCPSE